MTAALLKQNFTMVIHLMGISVNRNLTFLRPSVLWNLHRLSVLDRIFLNGFLSNAKRYCYRV